MGSTKVKMKVQFIIILILLVTNGKGNTEVLCV